MALTRRGPKHSMTPTSYHIVAGIIRTIPDEAARKFCADHFATAFNRRSASFDPYTWEKWTGGKVEPNSANQGGKPPPIVKVA